MSDFLDQIANLSPKRLALLALELHTELEEIRHAQAEPIAIVGMGCRFPGASNPEAFWHVLREGVDAVREVPPDRWDLRRYYDPDPETPGKMYSRYGGFLDEVDRFDAHFFGIAPREAGQMDPQQRLVLEVAWESLEHAGQPPSGLAGTRTGVFLGVCAYDYALVQFVDPARVETYTSSGAAPSILANRLSYLLDLQGPSLTLDTACSSSLVSVHLACHSLRRKECDLALAGGVNLILSPIASIALSKGRMLAVDGRCKTFDARADGYVRGEGCGIVVLKRLSDAVANGDAICGLVRGSAVNQDGYGNGLTAPNLLAQQAVIRQALEHAQLRPDQIGYVEAHGTGTALGDPIEVEGLRATYGQTRAAGRSCALGSVKTNIGHLEGAAGIAGLIKAVLALQHGAIPPHLHFQQLNPHISFEKTPFVIPTRVLDWPADEPRCAAVSSFGFGGTNAHIVLSEAPRPAVVRAAPAFVDRPLHILSLSAKTDAALADLAGRYRDVLGTASDSWPDVCFTANAGRSHFAERLAVVAESAAVASDKLTAFLAGQNAPGVLRSRPQGAGKPKVAFLFTGQGSQYVGMGRCFYDTQPTFRAALDRCDHLLRSHLAQPLLSVLYPEPGVDSPLDQTAYTQPALFALAYALAELWRSWGVTPGAVLGHSVGEYAAACIAGVFSLEDGLKLVAARGRMMQALPPDGGMAVVFAGETEVAEAIGADAEQLSIAALNGPTETVLSGNSIRLQAVLAVLHARGIQTRALPVSHAFHSPLMEPVLDQFEEAAAAVAMAEPRLGFISNLTGRPVEGGAITQARYWRRHARQPVRFASGIRALHAQGYRVFVEIGPQPVLIGTGRQCLVDEESVWLPSLRRGADDWQQSLNGLATLYAHGGSVDWRGFDAGYPRRRVSLPTYPFQRQQYPIGVPRSPSERSDALYEIQWERQDLPDSSEGSTVQPKGRWMILADGTGAAAALAELLEARGERCEMVVSGPRYERQSENRWSINGESSADFHQLLAEAVASSPLPWRGVVHLWSLDAVGPESDDDTAMSAAALRSCGRALHLVQALLGLTQHVAPGTQTPRLWFVTRGAQPVSTTEGSVAIGQAPLWGLGKVVALEHPELRCACADLDPASDNSAADASTLLRELLAEDRGDQIGWRSGVRYVARLAAVNSGRCDAAIVSAGKTYLITGGLGAIGLEVARWLVANGARDLVLIGRTSPSARALRSIDGWEAAGVKVTVISADVAQRSEVAQLLDTVRRTHPPLGGIVHAAGVLDDGILLQQTWARFAAVLAPKVAGAWNLHTLTQHLPLDFMVFFSSMASLMGTPGQGNYAAANAFLDGLAHHRRARGLPALSINWGPWAIAGMAASQDDRRQQRRAAQGIESIHPEEGTQILGSLLGYASAQVAVLPIEWPRFLQQFDGAEPPPLLAGVAEQVARQAVPRPAIRPERVDVRQQLERVPATKRHEFLAKHVREQAVHVLGLAPAFPVDPNIPLKELGMDSLMTIELAQMLSLDIGRSVPATMVFMHPTVSAIAGYLLDDMFRPVSAETERDRQ